MHAPFHASVLRPASQVGPMPEATWGSWKVYWDWHCFFCSLMILKMFCLVHLCMKLFADDVKLHTWFSHPSCDLQIVCDKLMSWSEQWRCELPVTSAGFTDLVIVSWIIIIVTWLMAMNCHWSNETRDLGVIFDNKLNFNSHVSAIAHKAHVRVSLILRTFVTRCPTVLVKAFITYAPF